MAQPGPVPPYPIRRMLAPTLQRSARLCVFQPGGREGTDQPGSPRRPDVERAAPPPNVGGRGRFLDHLELALAARQREPGNVGVLALALDDYQLIDDALGADALDLVVTEIERRLAATLRPGDTVAHLGSETFGAVCIRIDDARDLFAVSERLQVAAHQPLEVSGRQLFPTVSLGLTLAVGDDTALQLSRDAQAALAEARRRGPGTSELFDPALRERLMERLEIEHGLRSALQRGELLLHYQPQYDMTSKRVVAVEALVRWQHPERGLLEPTQFIGVAERSGLIVPLGRWVLEEACRQAAEWSRAGASELQLAVNVSVRQLEQLDFVATVEHALNASGFPADRLCLEVTESALMSGAETTSALTAVKHLGVKIAIDDFGVGFSSLAQLRDLLPLHQLKIDRSFISRLPDDPQSRAIVAAVVIMATTLGLEAVAEGVEESEQLTQLSMLGCGLSQGFLLARPQPAEAIPALLASGDALRVER